MRVESSGFRLREDQKAEVTPTGDGRFTFPIYGDAYEYFPGRPMTIPSSEESPRSGPVVPEPARR